MKQILFLCTGNYFRSRFAEELFNNAAVREDLDWRADSRGLRQNMSTLRNEGAVSIHTIRELDRLNINPVQLDRWPLSVTVRDFAHAHRIIAVCQREHEPMMEELFPMHTDSIEYWNVEDVHVWDPERALQQLTANVDSLVKELRMSEVT